MAHSATPELGRDAHLHHDARHGTLLDTLKRLMSQRRGDRIRAITSAGRLGDVEELGGVLRGLRSLRGLRHVEGGEWQWPLLPAMRKCERLTLLPTGDPYTASQLDVMRCMRNMLYAGGFEARAFDSQGGPVPSWLLHALLVGAARLTRLGHADKPLLLTDLAWVPARAYPSLTQLHVTGAVRVETLRTAFPNLQPHKCTFDY